jgi:hypothetical protein
VESHNAIESWQKDCRSFRKYVHQLYELGEYVLQVRSLANTNSRKFPGRG